MKRKLQFLRTAAITMLLSTQINFAQTGGNYPGGTGVTAPFSVPGTVIEFENFDLGNNANTTVNPTGVAPFAYSDNSAGNNNAATTTSTRVSDVDIADGGSGFIVNGMTNGEYLTYTINVTTSGTYHLRLNYAYGGAAGNKIQLKLLTTAGVATAQLLGNTSLANTGSSSTYIDFNSSPFTSVIMAGTYILQFPIVGGNMNIDYFQLILDTPLGVNDVEANTKQLKAYPNGSNTGVFTLNADTTWDVYSITGAKVKSGKGATVDLSTYSKGLYLLKTPTKSLKLVFK